MDDSKTFRILSIDGGGVLGLYSAKILEYIKNDYLKNKNFYEYFHLITGTSTGGIISLALASGKSIETVVDFYKNYGPKIFPSRNRITHFLRYAKTIFGNKYSNKELLYAAQKLFGDDTFSTIKSKSCCIPVVDIENCKSNVFKNPHYGLERDKNVKLKDVAIATSSAPLFFPIYSFDNYLGLVDGGLWFNNPCLIGLIEAVNHFVGEGREFDSIEILSIGNPHSSLKKSISVTRKLSSLVKWRTNLVEIPMKVSSKSIDDVMKIFCRNNTAYVSKYLRLCSHNITAKQQKLSLDFASRKAIAMINNLAETDYYTNKQEVSKFFQGVCNE